MIPVYEEKTDSICVFHKKCKHAQPHLHNAVELIYVTHGAMELGIAQELYHMNTGDLGIVFPDVIHHYQVFSEGINKALFIYAVPSAADPFFEKLEKCCPDYPIIPKDEIHSDILIALKALKGQKTTSDLVEKAYFQIVLARCIDQLRLVEKESVESSDIVYRVVSYIAKHFREDVTLEKMARDLGIGKYVISRSFSSVFRGNFKKYLNEQRLEYATALLKYTSKMITEVYLDAGFQSQRTFNRVFIEKYRMSPREYRKNYEKRELHGNDV